MLYQYITAYLSTIKFTRLVPGNVCVQAEGTMLKESYKKTKLSCQTVSPYYYEKITLKKSVTAKICLGCSLLLQNITQNKSVTAKVSLENLARNALKENKL